MSLATTLPRTKLYRVARLGDIIVLECKCGATVEYPGHPDDRTAVTCHDCGHVWTVES